MSQCSRTDARACCWKYTSGNRWWRSPSGLSTSSYFSPSKPSSKETSGRAVFWASLHISSSSSPRWRAGSLSMMCRSSASIRAKAAQASRVRSRKFYQTGQGQIVAAGVDVLLGVRIAGAGFQSPLEVTQGGAFLIQIVKAEAIR